MTFTGAAIIAGVMGWPIAHSLSPRLHGYWLKTLGIDGAYVPFAVPVDRLADAIRALPALGITGVNLTIPHKENAIAMLDEVDDAARRIGAVNCITVRPDNRLLGGNTDGYGFIESVREDAPNWNAASGPAVVIGAGGAARAVCVGLQDAGVPEIRVVNRTAERAMGLAAEFGAPLVAVPGGKRATALDGAALLVNATSLGMETQPPLDLSLAALPDGAVVADIVYAPLETDLLRAARQLGNPVVDGLGMLLHQARPAFASWFGQDPMVTPELRAYMLDAVR